MQNIRFYKENVSDKNKKKETIFKIIFDKKTEKFTFRTVRFHITFGSNISSNTILSSRILETSQIQIEPLNNEPTIKKRIIQSNLLFLSSTFINPIDETKSDEIYNIEFKNL